ncbi:hypothetical protein A5685_03325 [Mycobacterium colombiense]|uniref:Uncharacterized protein n=1 Tax=Mycobacterium colombiense TaxID=339268 RepID=A0A1A2S642_9MYCO|nr:hypothetical protein A5685_03325 [Mycobacterium colombiense]
MKHPAHALCHAKSNGRNRFEPRKIDPSARGPREHRKLGQDKEVELRAGQRELTRICPQFARYPAEIAD